MSVLLCCLFLLAAVSASDVLVYRDDIQDEQTLLLGGLFSVHEFGNDQHPCGPLSMTNFQLVESMVLAVWMINNDSTLLPNVTLAFEIRDTCASLNVAIQHGLQFVPCIVEACDAANQSEPGISGVVGPASNFIAAATSTFLGLFQIPQISYGASASFLSADMFFDYFFRTTPPDVYQARPLADIVVHFNWSYIMILHSDDFYGRNGVTAFLEALETLRNNASTPQYIATTIALTSDPPNYEEAVTKMSQDWVSNASVALLFGHTADAVGILSTIRNRIDIYQEFPLQNITWLGSDLWGDSLPEEFHSMANGMISVVPRFNPIKAFDDYFTSLNPQNTPNPWFVEFWEAQFNCSLDNMSSNAEYCDLERQVLSQNTTGYIQSTLVPAVFDAVYAFTYTVQDLINDNCPNGDLCSEILKNGTNGVVAGELLREYLLNVSFVSSSQEQVSFDANGDIQGAYTILNLKSTSDGDFMFKSVGTWDVDNLLTFTKPIEFVEGDGVPVSVCSLPCGDGEVSRQVPSREGCFTCEPCPENSVSINNQCTSCELGQTPNLNQTECVMNSVTFLTWSNTWGIIIIVLTCLGISATTFVVVVFLVYYKHELIKASSRELSAIQLAGILLCYILPFFFLARPSAAICTIRRFGVGFCFAVSYSALLVKTNRIHRIFNRDPIVSAKQVKFVSPLSQVLLTFAFIGVQVVIAMIWLALEPPTTQIILNLSQNELVCGESPYVGLSVSLGYNLFLLALSIYFAFLTRKVPENFNEAKFINITVYTLLISWLAFVPTYFATVELGTVFQMSSLAFGIILSASTTLFCLFMSKIFILFTRIKEDRKSTSVHATNSTGVN